MLRDMTSQDVLYFLFREEGKKIRDGMGWVCVGGQERKGGEGSRLYLRIRFLSCG